jgi:hypothetical protein
MWMLSGGMIAAVLTLVAPGFGTRSVDTAPTTITVQAPYIHCPACAKVATQKILVLVKAVPGVGLVQYNVGASTLTVGSKAGHSPSPRALWDAVVQAGYKPIRLEGSGGKFTARP